ncbi:hypothetical protein [Maridesulfovibrio sp.]|uniref:hypothetical protein n=1 Tax=Maridesulfovibrio sp. TaxID=2795000 RepID=UPI002A1897CE|nr:hypothetical protein [Maridesulfovibrio sp.]
MGKLLVLLSVCLTLLVPGVCNASSVNLLDGASVSLLGDFSGSDTSYVTDGFAESGTRWSKDSVWWIGKGAAIEISLSGEQNIGSISIQADSNDEYRVDYWDSAASEWKTAFTAGVTKTSENNWLSGLDMRESGNVLNLTTDKLRISAVSGDGRYSVSEVQAYAPTPVPPAFLLLCSGLGLLTLFKNRFMRR